MQNKQVFNALAIAESVWRKRIAAADISNHPTSKGNIAEMAWRELLQRYLPARYRVSTGFVISMDGGISDQIDCIICDNVYTPVFFGEHGLSYIPAEAVYAIFEVKQEVCKRSIRYASEKVESVRILHRTSAPYVGDGEEKSAKRQFHIIGGLLAHRIKEWNSHIETLNSLQPSDKQGNHKCIDVVLTAEKGMADFFEAGYPASKPNIYDGEGGLMCGILRLVQALQAQGTVPAVNWGDWLAKIPVHSNPR